MCRISFLFSFTYHCSYSWGCDWLAGGKECCDWLGGGKECCDWLAGGREFLALCAWLGVV